MSEEKRPAPEQEARQTGEEARAPDHDLPRARNGRSAIIYLIVLVGAAFLLLLFAYLMQQRNSEEIMGNLNDLRESMGAFGSIDQLVEENRALREENSSLKGQLGEAQGELVDAQGSLSQERLRAQDAEDARDALLLLEDLEYLCRTGQYEAARSLEDGAGSLTQILAQLDGAQPPYPEQPTLTERYQAVLDTLAEQAGDP